MMGNVVSIDAKKNKDKKIDLSIANIWRSWYAFRKGKRWSDEIHEFQYHLEENLYSLFVDLNNGQYQHGSYRTFTVTDNKKREISVAQIRDRVVHRLLYDYLNDIFDKTFIDDVWSCRVGKGLEGAIKHTRHFMKLHRKSRIWRADITKFFDNVDHTVLKNILSRKITDTIAMNLLHRIIDGFPTHTRRGIAIGNLTSQIFANIYLNELDRFMKYQIKPEAYLRYGDDFIAIDSEIKLPEIRTLTEVFLHNILKLNLHSKNNLIVKPQMGLKFLGAVIFSNAHYLNNRNRKRILEKLTLHNIGSYSSIAKEYSEKKLLREMSWKISRICP